LAARALYRHFLENGVELHEYHASEWHAKVAVIDDTWATVGSSNIDPFSLLLSREANVVVHDRVFAGNCKPAWKMRWRVARIRSSGAPGGMYRGTPASHPGWPMARFGY
jgi:phosphatidylserine/phosphatidylglycerophosphate/cardiolipin synthase-like enzyme